MILYVDGDFIRTAVTPKSTALQFAGAFCAAFFWVGLCTRDSQIKLVYLHGVGGGSRTYSTVTINISIELSHCFFSTDSGDDHVALL